MNDANARLNLAVVKVLGFVAVALTCGEMVLVGLGKQAPDWTGNALIGITGGLIGYLAREAKPATRTENTHA